MFLGGLRYGRQLAYYAVVILECFRFRGFDRHLFRLSELGGGTDDMNVAA